MSRSEYDANRYLAEQDPVPFARPKAPRKWPQPKKRRDVKAIITNTVMWSVNTTLALFYVVWYAVK